jgi:hypothetical protein
LNENHFDNGNSLNGITLVSTDLSDMVLLEITASEEEIFSEAPANLFSGTESKKSVDLYINYGFRADDASTETLVGKKVKLVIHKLNASVG